MNEEIIKHVKELMNVKNIKTEDIPTLIINTILVVEKFGNKENADKKQIAIDVIKQVLDESDVFGDYEDFILPMIPVLIDKFILIDKGKIKINTKLTTNCCCFV